jgi:hypothetical protein
MCWDCGVGGAPTGRRACGLNFLGADDARLLELVAGGQYSLNGFRNKDLREA